jgi:hypothetical protein
MNDMTSESNETNPTKNGSSPDIGEGVGEGVKHMFSHLTKALKSTLNDIWSLEVNTMVVSDIGGHRFNPIHFYESIYLLPDILDEFKDQLNLTAYASLLSAKGLSDDSNLRDLLGRSPLPKYIKKVFTDKMYPAKKDGQSEVQNRERESIDDIESTIRKYIGLKDRLRLAFQSCVIRGEIKTPSDATPASDTYRQEAEELAAKMVDGRKSIGMESDKAVTLPLPNLDLARSIGLLDNSTFLRELRSLRELYYLVGGEEATDSTNIIDLISAQTVIQMDGDVINRFHKSLLSDTDRDFLIQTHQQALSTGQDNWKNLMKLIIESMQTLSSFLKLHIR